MKKKAVQDESDEFEADEPEEFDESGSDWAPEEDPAAGKKKRGRPARASAGAKKAAPASKKKKVEEKEEKKGKGGGKKKKEEEKAESEEEEEENEDEEVDEEEEEEEEPDESDEDSDAEPAQIDGADLKPYTNGSFVVAKAELKDGNKPPLWKIDGKALLQKFVPYEEDGKQLYKSTSTYSGWTQSNRNTYAAAPVNFVVHTKKETIIEFLRDQVDLTISPDKDDAEDNS